MSRRAALAWAALVGVVLVLLRARNVRRRRLLLLARGAADDDAPEARAKTLDDARAKAKTLDDAKGGGDESGGAGDGAGGAGALVGDVAASIAEVEAVQLATRKGAAAVASRVAQAQAARLSDKALAKAVDELAAKEAEAVAQRAAKRVAEGALAGKALGAVAAEAAEEAGERVARELGEKALAEAAAKGAAKAVSKAWNAFDLASFALDIVSPSGYDNFTANAAVGRMRDVLEAQRGADGPPAAFPIERVFPDEYAAALGAVWKQPWVAPAAMALLSDADRAALRAQYAAAAQDPDGAPRDAALGARFEAAFVAAPNADPARRDAALYAELRARVPAARRAELALYKSVSTAAASGVSLSEAGVRAWNARHRADWLAHDDVAAPEPRPGGAAAPDVALFTDTYRVRDAEDPGSDEAPNMVARRLRERVALAAPLGGVVAMCEAPRNTSLLKAVTGASATAGVDPTDFGVAFDVGTGTCAFTREYCTRMGLETVFSDDGTRIADCKPKPGAGVAELLFGTEATRGLIRGAEAIANVTGRALQCAPDERQFGLDCYKPCKKGYEYTQDVIPTCGRTCPEGMRDDGTNCWQDTVGRGAGYGALTSTSECPKGSTRNWKGECWTPKDEYSVTPYAVGGKAYDRGTTYVPTAWGTAIKRCEYYHGKGNCEVSWLGVYPKCQPHNGQETYASTATICSYTSRGRCDAKEGRGACEYRSGCGTATRKCRSGYRQAGSCPQPTCVKGDEFEGSAACKKGQTDMGVLGCLTGDPQADCEREHGKGKCEQCLALWYPKCPDGYTARGCNLCEPPGGPGIKAGKDLHLGTRVGGVHTCAPDQRKVGDGPLPCFPQP
jgi:hypothetical protein